MLSVNDVRLVGRLAADPVYGEDSKGPTAQLSIETLCPHTGGTFIHIVSCRDSAQVADLKQYGRKGVAVSVLGYLHWFNAERACVAIPAGRGNLVLDRASAADPKPAAATAPSTTSGAASVAQAAPSTAGEQKPAAASPARPSVRPFGAGFGRPLPSAGAARPAPSPTPSPASAPAAPRPTSLSKLGSLRQTRQEEDGAGQAEAVERRPAKPNPVPDSLDDMIPF